MNFGVLSQAVVLFAATNIDDLLVLAVFFAQGAGHRGAGPQTRGAALPALPAFTDGGLATCDFRLLNTGSARGAKAPYDSDTYRLSVSTDAKGWEVRLPAGVRRLPNELATAKFGKTAPVRAYAKRAPGAA